jgi:murein DD-endopeptidase MepM/ murein hydrolase activator NlpD
MSLNTRVLFRASRGYRGGAIVCPVAGPHALDNNFGAPRPGGPHTGDDMPSPYGTPVVAVANGTIAQIVYGGWMGLGIIMRDVAGNEWWYAHLSARNVSTGEHVSQSEQIGNVGCSGNCSGPHLHFEYHPGGGPPANPYPILSRVC